MYNSKNIDDLRPDVAANCRIFLALCHGAGLHPLVTGTVRDEAFQLDAYEKGYSKSKRPAFHAQGIGLAFDFCRNLPGHEYDDLDFFEHCGVIGEAIGFEWGGRWRSFPDRPHLQWSGPRRDYKSSDIWAGRLPPPMPAYHPASQPPDAPPPAPPLPEAEGMNPAAPMTREGFAVILDRAGCLK
ncbi:MAG: M15 family metallopeptidase [Pseudoflavonifractor sp.]